MIEDAKYEYVSEFIRRMWGEERGWDREGVGMRESSLKMANPRFLFYVILIMFVLAFTLFSLEFYVNQLYVLWYKKVTKYMMVISFKPFKPFIFTWTIIYNHYI